MGNRKSSWEKRENGRYSRQEGKGVLIDEFQGGTGELRIVLEMLNRFEVLIVDYDDSGGMHAGDVLGNAGLRLSLR